MEINEKNMTQEEKELVLIDLCGRLPYGVRCSYPYGVDTLQSIDLEDMSLTFNSVDDNYYELDRNIEPYLRPLSSMTEEEYNDMYNQLYSSQEEFYRNCSNTDYIGKYIRLITNDTVNDWLNKNMFDYRGLIKRGLALEAPEGMYNN